MDGLCSVSDLEGRGSSLSEHEVLCSGMEADAMSADGLRASLARFGTPLEVTERPAKSSAASSWLSPDMEEASSEPTTSLTVTGCPTEEAEEISSDKTTTTASWLAAETEGSAMEDVPNKPIGAASWLAPEMQVAVVDEIADLADVAELSEAAEIRATTEVSENLDLAAETEAREAGEVLEQVDLVDVTEASSRREAGEVSESVDVVEATESVDVGETKEVAKETMTLEAVPAESMDRQVEEDEERVDTPDAHEVANQDASQLLRQSESVACRADDVDDAESLELEEVLMSKRVLESQDIEDEPLDLEKIEAAAQAAAEAAERSEASDMYDNAECEFPEEAEEAELAEVDEFEEKPEIEEKALEGALAQTVKGGTAADIEAAMGVVSSSAESSPPRGNSGKLLLMMLKGTRVEQPQGAEGAIPAVLGVGKWEPLLRPFCDVTDPKHFVGAEQFGHGHGLPVAGSGAQPVVLKDLQNNGLTFMYKPSGWATCSTPQWEGVEGNLIRWVWRRQGAGSTANPCHRLDRGTSGIVVVANSRLALRHIAMQITSRTMVKQYFGLCRGQIDPPQGALSVPLALSRVDKPLGACAAEGRTAVTRYRVLGYFRRAEHLNGGDPKGQIYSLVQLQIDHGRQHQIRLHMASINHPLVFDAKYSASCLRDDARVCTRLFLHAAFVQCTLPPEGAETLRIACRLPMQLKQTLNVALRLDRTLESSLQPEAIELCECLLDPEPSNSGADSNIEARLAARRRNEFFRSFNFSRAERDEVTKILSRLPTAEERSSAILRFRVLGDRTTDFIVTRFEKYVDGLLKQKHQGPEASSVEDSAPPVKKDILGSGTAATAATSSSSLENGYGPVSMHTENITCEVCGGQEKMEFVSFPLLNLRLSCRLQAAPMSNQLTQLLQNATKPHVCTPARIPPPPPPGPPPPLPDDGGRRLDWQERCGLRPSRKEEPAEEDTRTNSLSDELIEFIQANGNTVNGPVVASEFASRYNAWVRGDSKRNDGSLRKWIGDQPGVSVEHCGGNRWKVHYSAKEAQYSGKDAYREAEYDDYDVDDYQETRTEDDYSYGRRRRRKRYPAYPQYQ